MRRLNLILGLRASVAALLLFASALGITLSAKPIKIDTWKTKENMTLRHAGERPRITYRV